MRARPVVAPASRATPSAVGSPVHDAVARVLRAVADTGTRDGGARGVLLAISGGRDSMTLLAAAAAVARDTVCAVATFDHGTGPQARAGVALVRATAGALGLQVVAGMAAHVGSTEAQWRAQRWAFLEHAARRLGAAAIATAHTRDDQRETVLMRALRGASTRGLAALATTSAGSSAAARVRPLLACSRADVAAYAADHAVRFVEDPANTAYEYLRVRARFDLLPALARVRPALGADLEQAGAHAARWRDAVEQRVGEISVHERVPVRALTGCTPEALAIFWPAFAARAQVRLDRRAVARLVAFTIRTRQRIDDETVQPARVPVAAGPGARAEILLRYVRENDPGWTFVVRATAVSPPSVAALRAPDYA